MKKSIPLVLLLLVIASAAQAKEMPLSPSPSTDSKGEAATLNPTEVNLFDKNLYESMLNIGMSLENILKIVSQVKDGLIRDQDKFRLFPGIGPMVKSLAYGHKLYVVTSNESSVATSFLHSQGVTEFIDVFGSDKGGSKVNKILSIKNRYPEDTLFYIGDTKGDIYEDRRSITRSRRTGFTR